MTITVADIYRYPVKGLSAESLEQVELTPGECLPHDRRFALAHGSTKFDPRNPQWMPKTNFLMLMRDEKLAQLRVHFEPETGRLSIERNGKQVVGAKVTETLGRTLIGQFFSSFMAGTTRGAPRLVEAPEHSFSDLPGKVVSIINLASVRDLERVTRKEVHPLRFRANIYLEGLPAWREFTWAGREVQLGEARLEVVQRINRCAATAVNPETAARDLNVPMFLQRGFGHVDMGIYASVTAAGKVAKGDSVTAPE